MNMIKRVGRKSNELFCFFPLWGAGSFLFQLIETINRIPKLQDRNLFGVATTYLDHEMRLAHTLRKALLPEDVLKGHIELLRKRAQDAPLKLALPGSSSVPERVGGVGGKTRYRASSACRKIIQPM